MKKHQTFVLRRSWILSVFYIVPIVFTVGLVNWHFFDASFLPYMGLSALVLPLYLLLFELPHIIASLISFFDTTYIKHYKKHFIIGIPLLLVLFACLYYIDIMAAFAFYLVATMYHVGKQHTGIALLFSVQKKTTYQIWSWCIIVLLSTIYVALIIPQFFSYEQLNLIRLSSPFLLGIITLLSFILAIQTRKKTATLYIGTTLLMVLASYVLLYIEYIFLAIIIIRFTHDCTAFLFYVAHDINRNSVGKYNYIFKILNTSGYTLIIVTPLLAIGLGYILRTNIQNPNDIFIMIIGFGFVHYYLESIMWKRQSPHRQQIKIA